MLRIYAYAGAVISIVAGPLVAMVSPCECGQQSGVQRTGCHLATKYGNSARSGRCCEHRAHAPLELPEGSSGTDSDCCCLAWPTTVAVLSEPSASSPQHDPRPLGWTPFSLPIDLERLAVPAGGWHALPHGRVVSGPALLALHCTWLN